MKNKYKIIFAIILGLFIFSACNTVVESEPKDTSTLYIAECLAEILAESTAISGFIAIHNNTLYITPVEVFMFYDANNGRGFYQDPALRSIIYIEKNDTEGLTELGLPLENFPWVYIRPNWHSVYGWQNVEQANIQQLSFEITAETEFVFIDSERTPRNTNAVEDFLPYLYPTVVHFIEVVNGRVTRLVQEFGFTM